MASKKKGTGDKSNVRRSLDDSALDAPAPDYFDAWLRQNPANAIAAFIGSFSFDRIGQARLLRPVKQRLLEYLARRTMEYWSGRCATLDEALGLKLQGVGRGAKTPKERYFADMKTWRARGLYDEFLQVEREQRQQLKTTRSPKGEPPSDRALAKTAERMNLSEEAVRSIIRRKKKRVT